MIISFNAERLNLRKGHEDLKVMRKLIAVSENKEFHRFGIWLYPCIQRAIIVLFNRFHRSKNTRLKKTKNKKSYYRQLGNPRSHDA